MSPANAGAAASNGDTTAAVVLCAAIIILTGLSATALWCFAEVGRARLGAGARPSPHHDTDGAR